MHSQFKVKTHNLQHEIYSNVSLYNYTNETDTDKISENERN